MSLIENLLKIWISTEKGGFLSIFFWYVDVCGLFLQRLIADRGCQRIDARVLFGIVTSRRRNVRTRPQNRWDDLFCSKAFLWCLLEQYHIWSYEQQNTPNNDSLWSAEMVPPGHYGSLPRRGHCWKTTTFFSTASCFEHLLAAFQVLLALSVESLSKKARPWVVSEPAATKEHKELSRDSTNFGLPGALRSQYLLFTSRAASIPSEAHAGDDLLFKHVPNLPYFRIFQTRSTITWVSLGGFAVSIGGWFSIPKTEIFVEFHQIIPYWLLYTFVI